MGTVVSTLGQKFRAALCRRFPERRLFLRSDTDTRFVRLSPAAQVTALCGTAAFVAWSVIASVILLADTIGSGNVRENARRAQALYEQRLNAVSQDRDRRGEEAHAAQERFSVAWRRMSQMQSALLALEQRRHELEKGLDAIQSTLRRTIRERDAARTGMQAMRSKLEGRDEDLDRQLAHMADMEAAVDFLADALDTTAGERGRIAADAAAARDRIDDLLHEARLTDERNDRIFQQLEEAVAITLSPLDEMFRSAGHQPDRIIELIRRGYSGLGGPLTPLISPTGDQTPDPDSLRAQAVLEKLDRVNMYRIAAEKMPFDIPVKAAFRYTSGFGPRWGRMHNGTDFAGASGTPVHATGDGVVIHAGSQGGYGRLIRVRHDFGIETSYAHLSRIRVKPGQRVSRGDRIGDMGNTGRSTGTHLHYEIREGGEPVNPMNYIRAARDVF